MTAPIFIHSSAQSTEVIRRQNDALRANCLPARLLYESPRLATLWLAYHEAYSPARRDPKLSLLYRSAFSHALKRSAPTDYVILGCGGGQKDALFFDTAKHSGCSPRFIPSDISESLVKEALFNVARTAPLTKALPVVLDLQAFPEREAFFGHAQSTRAIFSCFGLLPNFDPQDLLSYLRRLLTPSDLLLLSTNLSPGLHASAKETILPQYDNAEAHAWYRAALDEMAIADAAAITVESQSMSPSGDFWRVVCEAQIRETVSFVQNNEQFSLSAGDSLQVFFSNRFTHPALVALLTQSGLQVYESFVAQDQEEGIYLLGLA